MKPSRLAVPVIALLAIVACQDETPTSPPGAHLAFSSSSVTQPIRTFDDHMVEIATDVPGFAGIFFDSTGQLVIQLTRLERVAEAKARLRRFFLEREAAHPQLMNQRIRETEVARAQGVTYDFRELDAWFRQIVDEVIVLEGVTRADIDERRNKIAIGVDEQRLMPGVQAAISRLAIPSAAVVVEQRGVPRLDVSLRGTVRPVIAGVEVNRTPGPAGACSLA